MMRESIGASKTRSVSRGTRIGAPTVLGMRNESAQETQSDLVAHQDHYFSQFSVTYDEGRRECSALGVHVGEK